MKLFKVFAAAALGLGLMSISAQASTVQTGVMGALPSVGVSGSGIGPGCGGAIADCFVMPIDQEVGIIEGFTSADNGGFSTTFQFETSVDLLPYAFSFSVNEPTDFSGLNFEIFDSAASSVFSLTPGQISGGLFFFAMAAAEVYTLVVSGMISLAGSDGANYTLQVSAVPIPGAAWLFGTALLGGGIVVSRRRRRRAATAA